MPNGRSPWATAANINCLGKKLKGTTPFMNNWTFRQSCCLVLHGARGVRSEQEGKSGQEACCRSAAQRPSPAWGHCSPTSPLSRRAGGRGGPLSPGTPTAPAWKPLGARSGPPTRGAQGGLEAGAALVISRHRPFTRFQESSKLAPHPV